MVLIRKHGVTAVLCRARHDRRTQNDGQRRKSCGLHLYCRLRARRSVPRICIASIRYFYPEVSIKLLAGDIIQSGLAAEVKKFWNVDLAILPIGDYGWGMVKLEPLFQPPGQRFMVVDVDTVFTGKVLDLRAQSGAPFLVDDEQLSDVDFARLYYDWHKPRKIDPNVQSPTRAFNVGR